MSNLPSVELLEATHDFPCDYTFKVFGHAREGFAARVVAAVREQLEQEVDPPFRTRQTASGAQVAVTLTPYIRSAWEVLAVYQRIRETRGLIMLW